MTEYKFTELKNKIKDYPISTILGHYLALLPKGRGHVAICPFHSDTNPSLQINDQKGLFRCFVCNTGGDAISFVEQYRQLGFVEALKELANILGFDLNIFDPPEKEKNPRVPLGQKILQKSLEIYQKLAASPVHTPVFQNFLAKRQINAQTAQTFALGLALGKSAVTNYLQSIKDPLKKEQALSVALEIGMIKKSSRNSSYFDTFRDRIIFPIWDQRGKLVGFSGRALDAQQVPKYLNSQESFLFQKKNLLFGFHLARPSILEQRSVILVEGHLDQISMFQQGIKNVVAVMGVGLSEYALNSLKNLTTNFFLGTDSDPAGETAAARLNTMLLQKGLWARYLNYSPAKDPDEFLQQFGIKALQELIANAPVYLDFQVENKIIAPFLLSTNTEIEQKLATLQQIFQLLAPIGDNLSATERLGNWGKLLQLESDTGQIVAAYRHFLAKGKISGPLELPVVSKSSPRLLAKAPMATEEAVAPANKLNKIDKLILREVLLNPGLLTLPEVKDLLAFTDHDEVKIFVLRLVDLVYEIEESEFPGMANDLSNSETFSAEFRRLVASNLFSVASEKAPMNTKIAERICRDLKRILQEEKLKFKRKALKDSLFAQEQGDAGNNEEIIRQLSEIDKQIKLLKLVAHPSARPLQL